MSSAPAGGDGDRFTGPVAGGLPPGLAAAFEAGGEMGHQFGRLDWSATRLGAPHLWPPSLINAVSMMLASRSQIVMFWGDDHLAFYNDAYLSTIGAKHPRALGEPAREHWAELWHVLEPLFAGVRGTGQAFRGIDYPFLLERHGFLEETYFDISYDPLRTENGTVGGIFCMVNETTGRVLGERRLRALAELGRNLSGLASWGELGEEAARVLDGHRADVPFALVYLGDGRPGSEVLVGCGGVNPTVVRPAGGGDPRGTPAALADVLAGGPATLGRATDFVTAPPETAADEVLVLPITAGTEPAGALVMGISRRLSLTEDYRTFFDLVAAQLSSAVAIGRAYELERARAAELAALDQAKSNFFVNVSHEFRTPLTLVLGPLEEFLADPDLPVRYREPLTMMHRNARRLLKLVNTVLDFSRLESGRLRAFYEATDLSDHTARLASTFRSAAERAGLRLVVDAPMLPQRVFVDRDLWEKILLNLLSNALKFTVEGGITVRVRAVDGFAQLEVADTGVGIGPDDLSRVFERFHRAPSARARNHEGTGIGLALVRELTELHGGQVVASSRIGEGSMFTVTVPFGAGHLPPERVAEVASPLADTGETRLYVDEASWWTETGSTGSTESPDPAGSPRSSRSSRRLGRPGAGQRTGATRTGRILVIDDNADLRDHLSRLLSPYWEVVTAPDGEAGFAEAVRAPFDLVLTDLMMPRLDGFGLVTGLRADPRTRHVPIVILSARAGAGEAVEGLAAGADDYLIKPFSGQELIARVRSNVELGQLRGQIIEQLRALADAAVAVNTARSSGDVLRIAARHAQTLVRAGRVVASASGARYEADGGHTGDADPTAVVPLVGSAGEQLGELRVWSRDGGSTDAEDAALAQLARLVGVRLENARLYEAERRIATTLRHSLLPESLPQLPGAIVASRYLPGTAGAEVGGDWYDVIGVGEDELVLVIGDVVGKGVPAAAAMGQLRNALRAYLLEGFDPGAALTRLNRLVDSTGGRTFATVVCLWFEPASGRLRYASAGHPAPMVIRPGGEVDLLHERALGPPIGALPNTTYPTGETRLDRGWRLLLYTDGLIEDRRAGVDVGLDRVRAAAGESGYEHVEDLVDALVERVSRQPRPDDVAVLALEVAEPDRFALRLPADPTKLSVLRRRLDDFLVANRVAQADRYDLTVAVSEAAANAIEHPLAPAQDTITIEAAIDDGAVTATVRDTGRWREATGAGFRGRGLTLIRALAEVTVDRADEGTSVTLRRRLS
jgi:signal transduction histidine kinase/serine phosphatase RsbU (regulator of sigma subunit)/DNA-binding response OmpR family regulator